MVYIILGGGFEEIEAIAPFDILSRGGVEVSYAGVGSKCVSGGHGITVCADLLTTEMNLDAAEMVVIPGGLGGVESIEGDEDTLDVIRKAREAGVKLAAICAGPRILAGLGFLEGRNITCYPGVEKNMTGVRADTGKAAVNDGGLITGRSPGAAIEFGLALLEELKGRDTAEAVRSALVIDQSTGSGL